jgi:hypothetical protein
MTLNDFCLESHNDVARFLAYWCTEHAKDPEGFPMDMPPGEWYEQFMTFLSLGNEDPAA